MDDINSKSSNHSDKNETEIKFDEEFKSHNINFNKTTEEKYNKNNLFEMKTTVFDNIIKQSILNTGDIKKENKSTLNFAKLAGIDVPRIINESTAAALDYRIQHDLINFQNGKDLFSSTIFGNAVAPSVNQINKFKEKIMAFDLGDRTFDLTILNIFKDEDGLINFKTEGDIHLRGIDFDKMFMEYCVNKFCENNELSVEKGKEILKNHLTYRRLRTKVGKAKKL
jgi:molecular chaperone DnaK (HSP70)